MLRMINRSEASFSRIAFWGAQKKGTHGAHQVRTSPWGRRIGFQISPLSAKGGGGGWLFPGGALGRRPILPLGLCSWSFLSLVAGHGISGATRTGLSSRPADPGGPMGNGPIHGTILQAGVDKGCPSPNFWGRGPESRLPSPGLNGGGFMAPRCGRNGRNNSWRMNP
jgi:hypothetical protein